MSRSRRLLDALAEDSPATHQVRDLCLVTTYLYRARSHEICGSGKVNELCCHLFPFELQLFAAVSSAPRQIFLLQPAFAAHHWVRSGILLVESFVQKYACSHAMER